MLEFEFEPTEISKKLFAAIAEKLKVPEETLRMICQQTIMKAEKTLEENKVTENVVIQITMKKAAEAPKE